MECKVSCALQLDYLKMLKLEEYFKTASSLALENHGLDINNPPASGHVSIPVEIETKVFDDVSEYDIKVKRAYVALRQFNAIEHPVLTVSFKGNSILIRTADDEERTNLFFQRDYFILYIELDF